MRALHELLNHAESALPLITAWARDAELPVELLPPSAACDAVLLALQVTTRSPLGAMAHGTGGVLVDGGWLRLLGSGHPRLSRDLAAWNQSRGDGFLLVGDDAVGGFFAINGGALGADRGGIYYLAPDTLAWEALEMGHTAFMQWAFSSRLCDFYRDLRWEGWQADVAALDADSCMGFYPFLFTAQGSVHTSARRPTPVAEHYAFMCQGGTQACSSP